MKPYWGPRGNGDGVRRMVDEQAVGARVKNSIIGVIRGTGEITQAAVETVASTVQTAIKESGETGGAAGECRRGRRQGHDRRRR